MFHKSTSNLIERDDDSDNKAEYARTNTAFDIQQDENIPSVSSSSVSIPNPTKSNKVVVEIEKADIHQEKMFTVSKIPQPLAKTWRRVVSTDKEVSMDKGSKNDENEIIQLNSSSSSIAQFKKPVKSPSDVSADKNNYFATSRTNTIVRNSNEEVDEIKETSFISPKAKKQGRKELGDYTNSSESDEFEVVDEKNRTKKKLKQKNRIRSSVEDLTLQNDEDFHSTSVSASETETSHRKKVERAVRREKPKKRQPKNRRAADDVEQYFYEKTIGIYLHHTSELIFDRLVTSPKIQVAIVDLKSGAILEKSDKNRHADSMDFDSTDSCLHNLRSKPGALQNCSTFSFKWEELLIINDDINHINKPHKAIFFELFNDCKIAGSANDYYCCWAFLVLCPGKDITNIDTRCELQLYRYQKLSKRALKNGLCNVYNQWSMRKLKYPATLRVTVKGLITVDATSNLNLDTQKKTDSKDLRRHSVVEKTIDGLGNYLMDSIKFNNDFGKLPGQSCKAPSKVIQKIIVPNKGCLIAKFSDCGEMIAYTEISEQQSYIHILQLPDFTELMLLQGHMHLIHDLNWRNCDNSSVKFLVSASSDYTAIVWIINKKDKSYSFIILPHPSFVYASIILLSSNHKQLTVVTGGRDQILRLWKINLKTNKFELVQEVETHLGYITTAVKTKDDQLIYTSDSVGAIYVWKQSDKILQLQRKIEIAALKNQVITKLLIHPRSNRIYTQTMGQSRVFVLSVTTWMLMQCIGDTNEKSASQSTMAITPCGTLLFLVKNDNLQVYNAASGAFEQNIKLCSSTRHIKTIVSHIDYHPRDLYMLYSVYGGSGGSVIFLGYQNERPANSTTLSALPRKRNTLEIEKRSYHETQLNDIIRKLDDVFLTPYDSKTTEQGILNDIAGDTRNRTNFSQTSSSSSIETVNKNTDNSKMNTFTIERNDTFTIKGPTKPKRLMHHQKQNKDGTKNNHSSDNNSKKSFADLTYNVEDEPKMNGNGDTYKIEKGETLDSDDTTISESMHSHVEKM